MKILLAGASGAIGTPLVRQLISMVIRCSG